MQNDMTNMERDNAILSNLHKDMPVYDVNENKIGDIDHVHFGEGHDSVAAENQPYGKSYDKVTRLISELFTAEQSLPEELREQLLRHGFVTVNDNPVTRTYFFIPEHIKSVNDGVVHLKRAKDEVMYK